MTEDKIQVLYVDDEQNNLVSFKALFRREYTVHIANSAGEALQILAANPGIEIVMSDQRMPGITGVELLEQVRAQYPSCVRMLVTGYTDISAVIDAVNRGRIFRYINKPWNNVELQLAIEEGHQHYLATSELAIRNEELEEAYEELDRFSYTITHDLRGPIVSTLAAIDLMQDMHDINEIKEVHAMVRNSMKNLDSFIKHTHSYYRNKRGHVQIAEINLQEFCKKIEGYYKVDELLNETKFHVEIDQQAPFYSDEVTLNIIIGNLLSNAFKYTDSSKPHHEVTLIMQSLPEGANIYVKDNGTGISEDHISKIFDLFYRASDEDNGSGFGLYNVKAAVHKLGGTISVSATLGDGSTFHVWLPKLNA